MIRLGRIFYRTVFETKIGKQSFLIKQINLNSGMKILFRIDIHYSSIGRSAHRLSQWQVRGLFFYFMIVQQFIYRLYVLLCEIVLTKVEWMIFNRRLEEKSFIGFKGIVASPRSVLELTKVFLKEINKDRGQNVRIINYFIFI